MLKLFFSALILISSAAEARLVNIDLQSQVKDQPYRKLPQGDWYSLASDTFLFKPYDTGEKDSHKNKNYYHGNGYWFTLLSEMRADETLAVNLKMVAYEPSSSYGYSNGSAFHNIAGVTWQPNWSENVKYWFRYFDLDRQTLGMGLLLEEKELSGFKSVVDFGNVEFSGLVSGTGGFYIEGELYDVALSAYNQLMGLHATYLDNYGRNVGIYDKQANVVDVRGQPDAFWGLFSRYENKSHLGYEIEAGLNNDDYAGLVRLKYRYPGERFNLNTSYQYRYYGEDYGQDLTNVVQQDYIVPEHYDKPYTNFQDIFLYDNNVQVHSATLNMDYKVSDSYTLFAENEGGTFDYADIDQKYFYFCRAGFKLFPIANQPHYASFLYSNKSLNARYPASGELLSFHGRTPLFTQVPHIAFEAYIFF